MTPRRLPGTILALGVVSLLTDASSEMIAALLPLFIVDTLGRGALLVGAVEGAADAVASALKLVSGALSDRAARRKPLVVAGYALSSFVRPFMALAVLPWHVIGIRVADRVGKGLRTSPRDALIADAAPPGRAGEAFGFHRAMDHAGAIIGPLIAAGLLAAGLSLRGIFLLAAVPAAIAVLALAFVREEPVARAAAVPARSAFEAWRALPAPARSFLLVLLLFGLFHATDALLLVRARDLGVSAAAVPLLWAAFHVAKVLASYAGGRLSDRVGRLRLIAGGWIVHAVAFSGFALATRAWHAWALLVGYGLHHGLTEPAEKALMRDLVPESARGAAYGCYHFVIGLAALPAGLLIGLAWENLGAASALAGCAAASLACAALLPVAVRLSPSARG